MNKILHLCGQNRAILGILNSAKPTVNSKLAFWYKPIEISYRYYSQQLRVARAPLNINPAAVVKDVIVYKYENPKYFKYMNLFALVQFAMFSAYSQFTMAELRDTPVNKSEQAESLPWYSKFNLGNPTFRYGLSIGCFVIGNNFLVACLQLLTIQPMIFYHCSARFCHYHSDLDIHIALRSLFDLEERWGRY